MPTQGTRVVISCQTGESTTETYEIPDPTPEEILAARQAFIASHSKALEQALENHIDAKAQEYTWKNITSAIAAAGTVNPFQANAIALKNWWAACWITAHDIQNTVQSGLAKDINYDMPIDKEFLAAMPEFVEANYTE